MEEISANPKFYAEKTIGVINPESVATATETSDDENFLILSPNQATFASGTSRKASALALIIKSFTLILIFPSFSLLSYSLAFITSSISILIFK